MTETVTAEAQQKKINQIRALLAKAEDPTTGEAERDNILENVDRLMRRYNIDEEILSASGTTVSEPVAEKFATYERYHRFTNQMNDVLRHVAAFTGVKLVRHNNRDVTLVGFPADVRYAQSLFETIKMTLLAKMDPKWESFRTEDENVTALYEAGWKWKDIAAVGGFEWNRYKSSPDGGKLIRAYRRQCKKEGRSPIAVQRKEAYRETFVESFAERINSRLSVLRAARAETDKQAQMETGVSTDLVLASRDDRVRIALWTNFPTLHPDAVKARQEKEIEEWRAERAAEEEARRVLLEGMTDRQRTEFLAKEARQEERDRKAYKKWEEEQDAKYDSAGSMAGRRAADSVNLSGPSGAVGGSRTAIG